MREPLTRRWLVATCLLVIAGLMGAAPEPDRLSSVVPGTVLGDAPVTVDLLPQPAAQAGPGAIIALAVDGIAGTVQQPVRIAVFINRPDAGPATAPDGPDCVGFIQLLPLRGTIRGLSHAFELSPAGGFDLAGPIRVTLVPVIGTAETPHGVSLHIGAIYLRRER